MAGGGLSCANHVSVGARFFCPTCDKHLCEQCAKHVWTASGFVDQCNACQALLEPLDKPRPGMRRAAHEQPEGGAMAFLERLPQMATYPFSVGALLTLAGLALLTMFLRWVPLIGGLLGTGITLSIFFHMIQRTANGEHELEAPDFNNLWDDVLAPVGRVLVAFAPILIGGFMFGWNALHGDLTDPTPVVLIYGGIILLPLLLAIAAMGDSFLSILNPVLWGESIGILGSTYAAGAVAFYLVGALQIYLLPPVLVVIADALPLPLVGTWIATTLGYIPMAWAARIIGGMCEPYMGEIE